MSEDATIRPRFTRVGRWRRRNRSHAVMSQRAEPHDSLDFFPTPPWATRALCEHVIDIRGKSVWEPACGEGYMANALKEYARRVDASDVHDYSYHTEPLAQQRVIDFLWLGNLAPHQEVLGVDWVITNPPFRLAQQFVERGLQVARIGVAVLVRSVFIESIGRYESLFKPRPPSIMAQFVERVPMVKGRVDPTASTATSYCWLVWYREPIPGGTQLEWIPPCRSKLERASDYARAA